LNTTYHRMPDALVSLPQQRSMSGQTKYYKGLQ